MSQSGQLSLKVGVDTNAFFSSCQLPTVESPLSVMNGDWLVDTGVSLPTIELLTIEQWCPWEIGRRIYASLY